MRGAGRDTWIEELVEIVSLFIDLKVILYYFYNILLVKALQSPPGFKRRRIELTFQWRSVSYIVRLKGICIGTAIFGKFTLLQEG